MLAVELLEAAVNIEGILSVQRKGNEFRDESYEMTRLTFVD